jgi:hypothetical protein
VPLRRSLICAALLAVACPADKPADACGEALPMEGSLCEHEGQECAPDEKGCGLYRGLRCDAGVWVSFEVGTGRCTDSAGHSTLQEESETSTAPVPCDDEVPLEGTPCAMDGEDCAPDPDACAGYIGAQCSAGVWMRYEVGPGDPEACSSSSGG